MTVIKNDMTWEKVAIPLVQGLDIKSRARLAEPTTLQIASVS